MRQAECWVPRHSGEQRRLAPATGRCGARSHDDCLCVCPGAKGAHGAKHTAAFGKLLSPTLVLKSSPTNLQMEIGGIHFILLCVCVCAQTWCSGLFVRLLGWLCWAKVISLPFLSSTPPSTFFTGLAAPSYLQTPWSQDNKIPWPPGKRQCPLTPVAT